MKTERKVMVTGTSNTPQLASKVKSYHVKTKSLSDLNQSSSQRQVTGDPSWNAKVMILSSLLPGENSSNHCDTFRGGSP